MAVERVTPESVGVKVGDFFYASWGYDQTNVDFYKVVALTPAGVKVQKWSCKVERSSGSADYVVPGGAPAMGLEVQVPGGTTHDMQQEAGVMTKRLQSFGPGKPYFRVASYAHASLWDGTPKYQTASGWGH